VCKNKKVKELHNTTIAEIHTMLEGMRASLDKCDANNSSWEQVSSLCYIRDTLNTLAGFVDDMLEPEE
jgi:hypothetical protein